MKLLMRVRRLGSTGITWGIESFEFLLFLLFLLFLPLSILFNSSLCVS